MLKALLKTRIASMYYSTFRVKDGKSNRSPVLIALLFFFLLLSFGSLIIGAFVAMTPLVAMGLETLYFAYAAIAAFGLCFIGSVFTAEKQLFNASDNDLLLSMPIKPSYILLSRMLLIIVTNFVFSFVIIGGAAGVRFVLCGFSAYIAVAAFAGILLLTLFATAVSCFCGWLIALISSRMRRKNIVTTVVSLAFLTVYMLAVWNSDAVLQSLVTNGESILQALKTAAYPFYAFGAALCGELLSALFFTLICIAPFAVLWWVLSVSFRKIVTSGKSSAKNRRRASVSDVRSQFSALFHREASLFLSLPAYILNSSLGSLFAIILGVACIVKREALLGISESISLPPVLIVTAGLLFCASMLTTSASSVSLEGKSFWIVRSLPVKAKTVLFAKTLFHYISAAPFFLAASLLCVFALGGDAASVAVAVVLPQLVIALTAFVGILFNVLHPKFEWINETAAVKQGLAVLFSMLAGWITIIVTLVGTVMLSFVIPAGYAALAVCLPVAAADYLLWLYVGRGLSRRFDKIYA